MIVRRGLNPREYTDPHDVASLAILGLGVLVFVAIGVVVQLKDANLGSARLILKRARSFNQ